MTYFFILGLIGSPRAPSEANYMPTILRIGVPSWLPYNEAACLPTAPYIATRGKLSLDFLMLFVASLTAAWIYSGFTIVAEI